MILRTLASAALAASVLAADLVVLTLFLNPGASLSRDAWGLLVALFLPYATTGTAALALLAALGATLRFWPAHARRPVESLPWFTSLALVATSVAAALFWLNLVSYSHAIPEEFVRSLAAAAAAVTGSALVLLAVGVDALAFPTRGRGFSAALVVIASAAAVALPLALRPVAAGPRRPLPLATETIQPVRRIVLVGIDGLSPDHVHDAVASGRLPVLTRLLRRGAYGPLATVQPTEGPPVWTTIFTGRFPRDHGVKSLATYRLRGSARVYELLPKGAAVGLLERAGLVTRSQVSAAARRRPALWNALNAFGIPAGVVRFWGTSPPERIQGFMLSDSFYYWWRADPSRAPGTLHPPDLLPEVLARAVAPDEVDRALVSRFVDLSVELPSDRVPWRSALVERALAPDLTYARAGAVLRKAYDPPFFATYFYGLDVVGHVFTRFARPERFGDVRPPEARRYGQVLDRYLEQVDAWIGDLLPADRPAEGEILLVVSGYGMEPVSLWRRLASGLLGETGMTGTHAGAPDGLIVAYGDGIRPGALVRKASVLDVAPTILYLMGLPVARDMEGRVLTEMLDEDFVRSHPVSFIPSYQSLAVTPVTGPPDAPLPPLPEEAP
jgi:predicted AlkP superfamily phosphohydrolase/phosphomutase